MFKSFIFSCCILIWLPVAGQAANRLGLIIGNDSYSHVPVLEKARNDATAMADTLSELGFEVTRVLDANRREMNRAIATFTGKLQPGDTALVFFAGHGVEIDGENYLLPVDIEAPETANEDFIKFESIGLSDVLSRVQSTGARTSLMFIDACRDNPFAQSGGRSVGGSRGLARVIAPEGTFVVFSAGARQQALDRLAGPDTDPNSVFTRTLLPRLKAPGLELRRLISEVRLEVRELALQQNHQQFPAYYDELLGQFYFTPVGQSGVGTGSQTRAATQQPQDEVEADFAQARAVNSIIAYEAFLEKHAAKTDLVVTMARRQLELLRREKPSNLNTSDSSDTEGPNPSLALDANATTPSRRETIRMTQSRLNALGCDAGKADGISGPRTRRAFQAFIDVSGSDLSLADLGTQRGLERLDSASGTLCRSGGALANTASRAKSDQDASGAESPAVAQTSLAGTWVFKANCPLFITTTGTSVYRSLGGNRYSIVTRDNIGNVGKGTVVDQGGGSLGVNLVWQTGASDVYTARLSASRGTISGTNYAGCRFTARRSG